ncbi:hypothetical protein QWI17_20180 [Gilvimarinus sp. SDUM040013]|uniref:Type II secretion system protein n=1 Tax=Gilvimarinus gilvus TaxID=3058038 RepID=A0ABU4RS50_9GAMM|nr:hypothetical protein [Gilvimarinus sp. SDUM040013]MDO3388175.1 hypothetical protein [Gilvimarinus sp. SDUM040013]MDX6847725.1 hypothetical protein [Gilvimarinus sp. SDUM040013]
MSVFRRQSRLLEYALVALVLSIFLAVAAQYYLGLIARSQQAAAQLQADYFKRAVAAARLYWQMQGQPDGWFYHRGVGYHMSPAGHLLDVQLQPGKNPDAADNKERNVEMGGATVRAVPRTFNAKHCQRLYDALINAPKSDSLTSNGPKVEQKSTLQVRAVALNGNKCRYYLMFVDDLRHYFDYDANSGDINAPKKF